MKIVKYILFLILIAFIAGSIYLATKDGDYQIEASRVIAAPAPLLFDEVNDIQSWDTWSPWRSSEDTNFEYQEEGFNWKSDELKDGEIITTATSPFSSIEQRLATETVLDTLESEMFWQFEPAEDSTIVTWGIRGSLGFKEKLAFLLEDKDLTEMYKPLLQKGLEELEKEITRQMEEYSINVDGVTRHGGGYYMYSTTATKINEVNARAAEMIRQVSLFMEDNNISISGKPFVIYNQRNVENNTSIFSAAVPTTSEVITPAGSPVLNAYLPAQEVLKVTLKGNHKNSLEAWETAYRYMEENGMRVNPEGEPFEVYITNPAEVQNPARWITEIYIPILPVEEDEDL